MRHRVARPVLLAVAACLTTLTTACSALDPGSATQVTTPAGGAGDGATVSAYYVSLGDSLSQGVQPASGGGQQTTSQGYADDVYAHYRATLGGSPDLVKLGCSGETSSSMLTGHGSPCHYQQGSQLAAALAFIKAHRSRIALITVDIGANDVVSCVSSTSVSKSCATNGLAEVTRDLPKILGALHQAVGSPTVIAGMTVYDPWLAYYLTGGAGKAVAEQSLTLVGQLNQLLTSGYRMYGVRRADVQGTFDTTDYIKTSSIPEGGTVPLDVARICQWTWMCAAQNIHANASGYLRIAGAFERIVGVLRKPAG